jgi:cytochrome b561
LIAQAPHSEAPATAVETRATTPAMRRMLYVAGVFVLIAGFQLFVLSGQTEDFFAWTIDPPLTAAFLGAGYWSSAILELGSARRREWSRARLAMPAVLFFTTLTLVLSVVHIDRFHTDSVFGIAWLVVYGCFPVAMATILFLQLRAPGADAPVRAPLAGWVRVVLVAQAIPLFILGAWLYAAPLDAASLWPWELTPLTGRAVGAWLMGTGFIAAHVAIENARERVDVAALSYAAFGALQLVAVARYPDTPDWSALGAVAYLGLLVSMTIVGLLCWLTRQAQPAQTSSSSASRSRAR